MNNFCATCSYINQGVVILKRVSCSVIICEVSPDAMCENTTCLEVWPKLFPAFPKIT